jgi:hypothetical protein
MNQTAQGLAALGRGPDTQLVHMAPGEVRSLQQLAMAHGGSLTINPETGLPEAGFLSSILPMVLGAGAMMIPGLQGFGAAGIAAGIGGLEALRTGSLKKGLMAGFGAYGGAGLAGGLTAAGAASGAGAAGAGTPEILGGLGAQPATFSGNLAQAGQGLTALPTSEAARTAFMGNAALKGSGVGGAKGLMQYGLAAAAPMMMETTTKQPEIKSDANMGQRYQFNAGTQTPTPTPDVPGYENQGINFGKEQRYFNPTYTPIDKEAARKLYGFAEGGPVEAMSDANSIGMNTGYPQADIRTGAYATPYQQPISRNVVTGPQGAGIDPYTGQQQRIAPAPQAQFAEGGEVGGYTYDPVTQMYVKKAGEGATMVSPTGGISGASAGSGYEQPLNPKTNDYLTWEETTPEGRMARDARMEQVSNALTLGLPGASLAAMLGGRSVNMPDLGVLFGTPQAYQDLVSNQTQAAQQYSNQALNDMSGRQESQMNSGEGIGGGDISGQSEGTPAIARGGLLAQGGISHLGDYSDGGRLLRGPGDGISDSIPAMIGKKQPARLADGEFVVPARIVSELGNGSTEAGARKLYAMMDRVQKARKKTVGKGKVAANSRSAKYLPA